MEDERKMLRTCAFVGNAAIDDDDEDRIGDAVSGAIELAYSSGCRTFIFGDAVGFSAVAALRAIYHRADAPECRLNMLLPCRKRAEKLDDSDEDMYEYLLGSADEVEYVCEEYVESYVRDHRRRLVDSADMLIGYVPDESDKDWQTLRAATDEGKSVRNLFELRPGKTEKTE